MRCWNAACFDVGVYLFYVDVYCFYVDVYCCVLAFHAYNEVFLLRKNRGKMNIVTTKLILLLSLFLGVCGLVWAEEGEEPEPIVSQYHSLKPAFVTNFGASSGKKLKFLKADISVRASSGVAINEVMNHDALVRHQIVMLLSKQTEKVLASSSGQESVRVQALKVVQEALKEETGDAQIDDLLFTSFIVQR